MELSFGEQIKILLKRNHMTIQDLANLYETKTGVKMTRQNLSQRLKRDNFSEQDMHTLAAILGFQVSIQLLPLTEQSSPAFPLPAAKPTAVPKKIPEKPAKETQITTADGTVFQIPKLFQKQEILGEINPLTGEEYLSNTVRKHPELSDYVQVYDRSSHEWIDVNEDYFWQFQANKKQLLGSDYQEPILI